MTSSVVAKLLQLKFSGCLRFFLLFVFFNGAMQLDGNYFSSLQIGK